MKYKYTHIGRLFYFDADIPSDVTEITMEAGEHTATARKLFWRFYWLT
jgi:hypothetical protein